MPNWEEKLLQEVRDDVKSILAVMPTLATKKEYNTLNTEFVSFRAKVKALGLLGAVMATIKAAWTWIV
tara:strand:+ start:37 stop:240 length:204 start_codon:yes stop_codon:yes gene_type:complete